MTTLADWYREEVAEDPRFAFYVSRWRAIYRVALRRTGRPRRRWY